MAISLQLYFQPYHFARLEGLLHVTQASPTSSVIGSAKGRPDGGVHATGGWTRVKRKAKSKATPRCEQQGHSTKLR